MNQSIWPMLIGLGALGLSGPAAAQTSNPAPGVPAPTLSTPAPPALTPVPAPQSVNALHEGLFSVTFDFPNGGFAGLNNISRRPTLGSAVAAWYMIAPQLNAGLAVGLSVDQQTTGTNLVAQNGQVQVQNSVTNVDFVVAPGVKYYLTTAGTVVPYALGQLAVGLTRQNGESEGVLFLNGGFGVEFFPVRNFAVGGRMGLTLDVVRPAPAKDVGISTFASALYIAAFF